MRFGAYRTTPTQGVTEIGYTGHRENMEVGLVYMNARYYVPSIGRFASADTIVPDPTNPQQFNRYAYVLNNPIRLIDPTGHASIYTDLTQVEAQEMIDSIDFLLLQNAEGTTVMEFFMNQAIPSVASGAASYAVAQALAGAGFAIGGVSSATIGIGVSIAVGAAYAWNDVATSNAMLIMPSIRDSLQSAMDIADEQDIITLAAESTWLDSDSIRISIDLIEDNHRIVQGKYYDSFVTDVINNAGQFIMDLIVAQADYAHYRSDFWGNYSVSQGRFYHENRFGYMSPLEAQQSELYR